MLSSYHIEMAMDICPMGISCIGYMCIYGIYIRNGTLQLGPCRANESKSGKR